MKILTKKVLMELKWSRRNESRQVEIERGRREMIYVKINGMNYMSLVQKNADDSSPVQQFEAVSSPVNTGVGSSASKSAAEKVGGELRNNFVYENPNGITLPEDGTGIAKSHCRLQPYRNVGISER